MKFRKFDNSEIESIKDYLVNFKSKYCYAKFVVGTDSIQSKRKVTFATIIAIFYPTNVYHKKGRTVIEYRSGAHLVYTKYREHKNLDLFTRLWKEIEFSHIVADMIEEYVFNSDLSSYDSRNVEVHLDINPDENHKSNKIYEATKNYFKSLGYKVNSKPDGWVASCAADLIARH